MSYNYHGIYDFSDREIDQICFLVKRWACGDAWVPVDARRFTKQVKEWAKNYNLLEMRDLRLCLTHCLSWYNVSHTIFLIQSLPVEVTWRLVEPMLNVDGSTGYSIVNNKLWMNHFGISPENGKDVTPREYEEKVNILLLLNAHHYLIFQMVGTTWSIYRDTERGAKLA